MGIQWWDNIPPRTTRGEVFAKTLMGLLIWGILAFLFFIIVSLAGDTLTTMLQTAQIEGLGGNPLLPMLMLIIAFITTFIGTASVAGLYNVFYSKDYYDLGSMLRSVMIVNVILFLFFAPIYLLFASNLDSLFFVIAFHIVFSVFLCMCQMEILVN